MSRIGLIGLGLMGHGIARNLIVKGHELRVLAHRKRHVIDELVEMGAREATRPAELAAGVDFVITCVPTSRDVEGLVYGDDGLLMGARPGMFHIDTSTADPSSTARIAADYAARGVVFVDAPLARTPKEAHEGRLNVMVGATDSDFDRVMPVLKCFAENVFHVGGTGMGHKVKLINNFIVMGNAAIAAEAAAAAKSTGVDPNALFKVASSGGANSVMLQIIKSYLVDKNEDSMQFSVRNARKDLQYFSAMMADVHAPGLLAPAVLQTLNLAGALGYENQFVPRLADLLIGLGTGRLKTLEDSQALADMGKGAERPA